jgi:hypothetical protein
MSRGRSWRRRKARVKARAAGRLPASAEYREKNWKLLYTRAAKVAALESWGSITLDALHTTTASASICEIACCLQPQPVAEPNGGVAVSQ